MSWWFVQLFYRFGYFQACIQHAIIQHLNFFFIQIWTYTTILCITVLTDSNEESFHFRVLSGFFPPDETDGMVFQIILKSLFILNTRDTVIPVEHEMYCQHGLCLTEFINILHLCHDSFSEKEAQLKSFRITALKLLPFIVNQDIQSRADKALTKVQGIR